MTYTAGAESGLGRWYFPYTRHPEMLGFSNVFKNSPILEIFRAWMFFVWYVRRFIPWGWGNYKCFMGDFITRTGG
jgi:hypothetical protein